MLEKGIVVELKGDRAAVKVQRQVTTGCGCGNMLTTEETMVEVKNLCQAGLNDWVALNSTHDIKKYRDAAQLGAAFLAFISGIAVGEYLFPHFGLIPQTPVSLGIGAVLGIIGFLTIQGIYRKKPLPAQVAYKLLAAENKQTPA